MSLTRGWGAGQGKDCEATAWGTALQNAKESAHGAAKGVAGRVCDDRSLEAEGNAQRAKGA